MVNVIYNSVKELLWDFIINGVLACRIIPYQVRTFALNLFGTEMHVKSAIHSGCYVSGKKLVVGKGSYINRNCVIDSKHASVTIGNNVGVGYNCKFFTTNHDYSNCEKRTGKVEGEPIYIGNGVWLGGDCVICPGVTVADGCVIAAGSVVTRDCEENCLYAGNPARKIKQLEN